MPHGTISSMKKTPRIAFAGDLTVDKYIKQKEIRLGGSSFTGAMWAKRLGATSSIVAAVGSDKEAKRYSSMVTREHIEKTHMTILPGATSSIEINTTNSGERQYGAWDPGVLADYRFSRKDFSFMRMHDAVVLTVYDKTLHLLSQFRKVFASKRKKKFLRVVDFGDVSLFKKDGAMIGRYLPAFDIFIFGLDKDADESLIDELRLLARQSKKLFVITLNRYGAAAFAGDSMWGTPGHSVRVVDTTGAGDSFLAAFLVSYLATKDVQKSLKKGTELASHVIQNIGGY